MNGDKNSYTRESNSNGRRSSILKRQESCLSSEGADGNSDCPRTPRRVSFARTAMVRYLHISLGDESCASASSSSDNNSTSSGSSQSTDNDSVFIPDALPHSQARCEEESAPDTSLTEEFLSSSADDQPHVLVKAINTFLKDAEVIPSPAGSSALEQNKTILYTSMNMSTSDISQLSNSILLQDGSDEMDIGGTSVRHQDTENHTILYTNLEEYGCCMDITSNISQLSESSLHQGDDSCHQDGFFRKEEIHNKPGLNRRPSFADEGTNESTSDQAFMKMDANTEQQNIPESTMVFLSKDGDMEITQNLTQFNPCISYPGAVTGENMIFKPKPKLLDDLFQLVKKQKPTVVTDCNIKENFAEGTKMFVNKGENEMGITQKLTKSVTNMLYLGSGIGNSPSVKSKPKMLDDLIRLVKTQKPNHVTDYSTEENVSQGLEDMEITGELSQVIPRTALSDITTKKTLTPIEEMSLISTNISLADQENRLPKASNVLQSEAHVSYLKKVCSKLEQTYGVQYSSNSFKPDMSFEKAIISPRNKENYPVLNLEFKPLIERQRVIAATDPHAKSVQFEISSLHSIIKDSSGTMKVNECQARSICSEQKAKEDSEMNILPVVGNKGSAVQINIPPGLGNKGSAVHISVACSEGKEAASLQKRESKTGTYFQNQELLTVQTTDEAVSKLQREVQEGDVAVVLKDSDDMEVTATDTVDVHIEQMYAQEYSKHAMVIENQITEYPDSSKELRSYMCDEMEMTEGLSKTIYIGGKGAEKEGKLRTTRKDYKMMVGSAESTSSCLIKIKEGPSREVDEGNTISGETFPKEGQIFNNSNMEMTECLSRTVYMESQSGERSEKLLRTVSPDPLNPVRAVDNMTDVISSHQMELKECTSTAATEDSKMFGKKCFEDSKDFSNCHMEMTESLSRTIYAGDMGKLFFRNEPKNMIGATENMSDIISSQLELEKFPAKLEYKMFEENNCQNSEVNNSYMEMTESLSKTISAGTKTNERSTVSMRAAENLTDVINNSKMELKKHSSTLYKDYKSFGENNSESSKVLNNDHMEIADCLSKTICIGSEFDKETRTFPVTESSAHFEFPVSAAESREVTKCSSKVILKDKNMYGKNYTENSKVFSNNQMDLTKGLSKTIHIGSKFDEGTRKLPFTEDRSNSEKSLSAGASNFQKEIKEYSSTAMLAGTKTFADNISDKSQIFGNSHMDLTEGLSKAIYIGTKAHEEHDITQDVATRNLTDLISSSQAEMTKCSSKYLHKNNKEFREMTEDVSKTKLLFSCMYGKESNKLPFPEVGADSKKTMPGTENTMDIISRSHMELKEYPSEATFKGNKIFLGNGVEKNNMFTNIHTEMREGTAHIVNHRHPVISEIKESEKHLDYNVPRFIDTRGMERISHSSDVLKTDCIMDTYKCNLGMDPAANNLCSNVTDGCYNKLISFNHTKHSTQADLTAVDYTGLKTGNFIKGNEGISPVALEKGISDVRKFQAGNLGIIQCSAGNMTFPNNVNSRESSSSSENKEELLRKVNERNTLESVQIMDENTVVQDIDQKREALRQALNKEMGFPLSLSSTTSTFDVIQRRKTCNLGMLLGKGMKRQVKNDHLSVSSQVNIDKTMSVVDSASRESDKKWFSTADYTDPNDEIFKVMEHSKGLPTFIYEHTSSYSGSENTDRTNSAETELQAENSLNIDSESPCTNSSVYALDASKTILSGGAKLNAQSPPAHDDVFTEALESKETLNNQEMPELTEEIYDFRPAEKSFEYKEDDSLLSDLELIAKMSVNLQDLYESLGVSRLEGTPIKSVPIQVPTTTVKEKLIAKVLSTSRLNCLKQHTNEIEATVNRSKQECTVKLTQFSDKPSETLVALFQNTEINNCVSELKTKAREMIHSCRVSAQALWKRHQADYLIKYSNAVEAARQILDCQVGNVISDTEKVLDLIANVDKCLYDSDMICRQEQELVTQQKELEETERETQQLKLHCKEIDERVMQLTEGNKEAVECLRCMEAAEEDIKERLCWMNSLIEWTIVKNLNNEMHFGFLFGTLILEVYLIDSGSSHRKISKVTVQSKLGVKSKPWAKLAHSLAVSSIDCDKLQNSYKNYDQLHELLADVSTIVNTSRHFSTELKQVHLKHGLSIVDNRLSFTVLNRKTRQKIQVDTIIALNSHLQFPLLWNVTTLLGNVSSQAVKSAVDGVEGGPNYITRILSRIEQFLAQNKG